MKKTLSVVVCCWAALNAMEPRSKKFKVLQPIEVNNLAEELLAVDLKCYPVVSQSLIDLFNDSKVISSQKKCAPVNNSFLKQVALVEKCLELYPDEITYSIAQDVLSWDELPVLSKYWQVNKSSCYYFGVGTFVEVNNGSVSVWHAYNASLLHEWHFDEDVQIVYDTTGAQIVLWSSDGWVQVRSVVSGKLLSSFITHDNEITDLTISSDGTEILIGSIDGVAQLWDVQTGRLLNEFGEFNYGVYTAAFHPDGQYIALVTEVDNVFVLDKVTREIKDLVAIPLESDKIWFDAEKKRFVISLLCNDRDHYMWEPFSESLPEYHEGGTGSSRSDWSNVTLIDNTLKLSVDYFKSLLKSVSLPQALLFSYLAQGNEIDFSHEGLVGYQEEFDLFALPVKELFEKQVVRIGSDKENTQL